MFRSKKIKAVIVIATIIVLSLIGYLDPVVSLIRTITQPIIRPFSSSTLRVKDFFFSFGTLKDRLSYVSDLEQQIALLRSENARLTLEGQENEILRQQLGLKKNLDFVLVPSQVVSRDPVGARSMVSIDKGESFGVSAGNAVLDESGNLLGVVVEVFSSSSNVLIITDGAVKIDALVLRNNALGVVNGSHGLGLDLDLISQDVEIEKGDKVVTSGLTGEIPAGILIGNIDEIQSSESDLFQSLSIVPAAKTKDFRFVLVVTDF
jgi:rod shape-determining protein MreC